MRTQRAHLDPLGEAVIVSCASRSRSLAATVTAHPVVSYNCHHTGVKVSRHPDSGADLIFLNFHFGEGLNLGSDGDHQVRNQAKKSLPGHPVPRIAEDNETTGLTVTLHDSPVLVYRGRF